MARIATQRRIATMANEQIARVHAIVQAIRVPVGGGLISVDWARQRAVTRSPVHCSLPNPTGIFTTGSIIAGPEITMGAQLRLPRSRVFNAALGTNLSLSHRKISICLINISPILLIVG